MSLMKCLECGNEISTSAKSCPKCGRPVAVIQPVIERKVIVTRAPEDSFPKWIIAMIAILAIVVVFLIFVLTRSSDQNANMANANANIANQRKQADSKDGKDTTTRTENPPNRVEVPSTSTTVKPPETKSVPQNPPQTVMPSSQTDVVPDKGSVTIEAKISTKTGAIQSVKNEKFYLLDNDLESILSEANLKSIEGQSLSNSFGLAVLHPEKYGDFHGDSLKAIKSHIKYDTTTDGGGKASMKGVKPSGYYLFGITKTRSGFAIWNSPVDIVGGDNKLDLSPAAFNEISE